MFKTPPAPTVPVTFKAIYGTVKLVSFKPEMVPLEIILLSTSDSSNALEAAFYLKARYGNEAYASICDILIFPENETDPYTKFVPSNFITSFKTAPVVSILFMFTGYNIEFVIIPVDRKGVISFDHVFTFDEELYRKLLTPAFACKDEINISFAFTYNYEYCTIDETPEEFIY